ncbi:hypothetical protein BB561_006644 [Smittium simulii]|uniref:Uncharacterized protein n=1 Tax=Smittium simulii TaxID=133385 RepID=A0A2T9Y2N9_9FUNG|nr:hypothetical protein BB561_006644 [Smittium simulii]
MSNVPGVSQSTAAGLSLPSAKHTRLEYISVSKKEKHANVLINHNKFAVLASNVNYLDALCKDTVEKITGMFAEIKKLADKPKKTLTFLLSKILKIIKKRREMFKKINIDADMI